MRAPAFVAIMMLTVVATGCGGDDTSAVDAGSPFIPPAVGGMGATPPVSGTAAPPPTGGMTATTPVDAGSNAATDAGADAATNVDAATDAGTDSGTGDDGGVDPCGNGVVDPDETCDPALQPCCMRDCSGPRPATRVCRASAGLCDVADHCDGVGFACPTDVVLGSSNVCRPAAGECDVAENCNGTSGACPTDGFATALAPCGDTVTDTECNAADSCDGSGNCSARLRNAGVQCTDENADDCEDAQCNGSGDCVQSYAPETAGTPCPDGDTSDCDDAQCNGSGACVQDYGVEDEFTLCGDNTDTDCNAPNSCDAAGNCDERFVASDSQCTDENLDDCNDAQCDGSGACVQDHGLEPDQTVCGGGGGTCWDGLCCLGETIDPEHDGACDLTDPDHDLVFVTSSVATGGSFGSLAGADAVCNTRAAAANLEGMYVAWLSSSTANAANRIGDGPFIRIDGAVVATDLADLVDDTLTNPISKTELGATSTVDVWTGTSSGGTVDGGGNHCGDWADDGASGMTGDSSVTNASWTQSGARACGESQALYCFQLDCAGVPDVDFANDPNNCGGCGVQCTSGACQNGTCLGIVFVTSVGYAGNLLGGSGGGGVADGDAICDMHASSGGLNGTFKAWLSGFDPGASMVVDAKDRIYDQPYILPDGTMIAPNGLADLTTASLLGPIDHDESAPGRTAFVWTGTNPDGTADSQRCSDWTTASIAVPGAGGYTTSGASDPYWTEQLGGLTSPYPCSQTHTLYCFQDGP